MRRRGDKIILSPSDLMRFQGCEHATALDLRLLKGEALVPAADTAGAQLIQAKGDAHEQAFLDTLKASSTTVNTIDKDKLDFQQAVAATQAALRKGPEWIYQAAFAGGNWGGHPTAAWQSRRLDSISASACVADIRKTTSARRCRRAASRDRP